MSSEPLATTPTSADATTTAASAASAERGLLIAVFLMVLLGATAMFLMN